MDILNLDLVCLKQDATQSCISILELDPDKFNDLVRVRIPPVSGS